MASKKRKPRKRGDSESARAIARFAAIMIDVRKPRLSDTIAEAAKRWANSF